MALLARKRKALQKEKTRKQAEMDAAKKKKTNVEQEKMRIQAARSRMGTTLSPSVKIRQHVAKKKAPPPPPPSSPPVPGSNVYELSSPEKVLMTTARESNRRQHSEAPP